MPSETSVAPTGLRAGAEKLRELANRYEQFKKEGNAAEALGQRTDALRKVADAARPVAAAAKLLAAASIPVPGLPRERLATGRDSIARLAAKTATDPDAVLALNTTEPKAALAAVADARAALANAWEQFANEPVPGEAILPVLVRFEAFRAGAARAASLRASLTHAAGRLPAVAGDIDKVRTLRKDLAAVFGELDGAGVGADRLDFLRRCAAGGVPLAEVLSAPDLAEWLRENPHLVAALRVRAG